MAQAYTVRHAFVRKGTYYTRDNAHMIPDLSASDRKELIERGYIEEFEQPETRAAARTTKNKE